MAGVKISAKYPPHIDVTRAPIAYGDRALPRMNRELNDEKLITRQRALMSLCDYLHDPEHIATAIRTGIPCSLKALLTDKDLTVRHKSTECLYVMAGHAIGRQAFCDGEIIVPLSKLFDDNEDIVRRNAHLAMEMLSETPSAASGIVACYLVPGLVEKLAKELDEIKLIILDTLHFCMKVHVQDALDNGLMKILTDLLDHNLDSIRSKAARDIMDLSVNLEGKNQAVEMKCMYPLVALLRSHSSEVRASAAGAISMIAVTTKGKYTALEAKAIEPLVELVDDANSEVRVNALKALTCLSEAPEGRQLLQDHVDRIEARQTADPIPANVKAATIAVKSILWTP